MNRGVSMPVVGLLCLCLVSALLNGLMWLEVRSERARADAAHLVALDLENQARAARQQAEEAAQQELKARKVAERRLEQANAASKLLGDVFESVKPQPLAKK